MIVNFFKYYKNIYFPNLFFLIRVTKIFFSKKLSIYKIIFHYILDSGFKNLYFRFKHKNNKRIFQSYINKNLVLTKDWFTHNIPVWNSIFDKEFKRDDNLKILEIGSFEGLSSFYFLDFFKVAKIHCVETFTGSDEHSEYDFNRIKKNFSSNMSKFETRYQLFDGSSDKFFTSNIDNDNFDIVYIDGSHKYEDVLNDAKNSIKLLNKNGIIIFDDFLRQYYENISENPSKAIIEFLIDNEKIIKILNVDYQLIIQKKKL